MENRSTSRLYLGILGIIMGILIMIFIGSCVFAEEYTIPTNETNITIQENQSKEIISNYIIIPDIQSYYTNGKTSNLISVMNWIVTNKKNLSIKAVLFVGDLVNSDATEQAWENAQSTINILAENNITYLISKGNHDDSRLNYYFPNRTKIFSDQDSNITILALDTEDTPYSEYCCISEDMMPIEIDLNNTKEIIKNYSNNSIILLTHVFDKYYGKSATVTYLENNLIRDNPNLFLVLSGHYTGNKIFVNKLDNKSYYSMLQGHDVTIYDKDGNCLNSPIVNEQDGMIRIVSFNGSELIRSKQYSPITNITYTEAEFKNFSFEYITRLSEECKSVSSPQPTYSGGGGGSYTPKAENKTILDDVVVVEINESQGNKSEGSNVIIGDNTKQVQTGSSDTPNFFQWLLNLILSLFRN